MLLQIVKRTNIPELSHAWASLGLPSKMQQYGMQIFYFVRVKGFSAVFNLLFSF